MIAAEPFKKVGHGPWWRIAPGPKNLLLSMAL